MVVYVKPHRPLTTIAFVISVTNWLAEFFLSWCKMLKNDMHRKLDHTRNLILSDHTQPFSEGAPSEIHWQRRANDPTYAEFS
jgi:hypothetical protein